MNELTLDYNVYTLWTTPLICRYACE